MYVSILFFLTISDLYYLSEFFFFFGISVIFSWSPLLIIFQQCKGVNSGKWWRTRKTGMLQCMRLDNWTTTKKTVLVLYFFPKEFYFVFLWKQGAILRWLEQVFKVKIGIDCFRFLYIRLCSILHSCYQNYSVYQQNLSY